MTDIERASPPSRKRILVVDDSSLVRLYYRDTLEKAGFEVEQAINGIEAMEKVLAQPFDLAIVDVNMPRMDGRETLKAVKTDPALRHIPVIVLTTSEAEEDVTRAYGLGVSSFVVKPDSFDRLVAVVRSIGTYWLDVVTLPADLGA